MKNVNPNVWASPRLSQAGEIRTCRGGWLAGVPHFEKPGQLSEGKVVLLVLLIQLVAAILGMTGLWRPGAVAAPPLLHLHPRPE